ncbi:hypothetical protein DF146_19545 [Burkholderia cenocepacia]|nr:hypothetical protein DF165_14315 [Burkholderia cenocepacia]RQU51403.1 hypothetical protein DF146_19545 [Burkholderia cenocepacia]
MVELCLRIGVSIARTAMDHDVKPQTKSYLWAQVNGSGLPIRMVAYSQGRTHTGLVLYRRAEIGSGWKAHLRARAL